MVKSGPCSWTENTSRENEVLSPSKKGPYDVLPEEDAVLMRLLRLVSAVLNVLLEERLCGAGKAGPCNGQVARAYERGRKAPSKARLEKYVKIMIASKEYKRDQFETMRSRD